MIIAYKARTLSKHRKLINDIEDIIEKSVNEAIHNGNFGCAFDINADTPQEVRDTIKERMEKLGYTISIPEYEPNHPDPNENWFNVCNISW